MFHCARKHVLWLVRELHWIIGKIQKTLGDSNFVNVGKGVSMWVSWTDLMWVTWTDLCCLHANIFEKGSTLWTICSWHCSVKAYELHMAFHLLPLLDMQ
jgi:hypothetical protein